MNIFLTDRDTLTCARNHCDVHVRSQPKEAAQIGCSALHLRGLWKEGLYRPTHLGHPCVKWAAESFANLEWLLTFCFELNREFSIRRAAQGRGAADHAAMDVMAKAWELATKRNVEYPDKGLTPHPQVMPVKYRGTDTVQAYRRYILGDKRELRTSQGTFAPATWTLRGPPVWWVEVSTGESYDYY